MKVVINGCYGGFSVSRRAMEHMGLPCRDEDESSFGWDSEYPEIARNDPRLIKAVEELGEAANGEHAKLLVVEFPDKYKYWEVDEYDGNEGLQFSETPIHYLCSGKWTEEEKENESN